MIWLNIYLITVSVLLMAAILLQQRGAGGAGMFGGGDGGAYHVKRGFEKWLFVGTIVLTALFIGGAFTRLFLA